ncbi:uncharacterized protein LOC132734674 [Ruditapes philippinarum]|uniref:uncharacterized protein LOC132734674 n=1 Tax=Ruditapes philippinarum TaxID=129788 RepID=UPI00295BC6B9|nr:uncharacterized protein LOC132734674 [Ruditapes philippinarum]
MMVNKLWKISFILNCVLSSIKEDVVLKKNEQTIQSSNQVNHTTYNRDIFSEDRYPQKCKSNQFTFAKEIQISPLESIFYHTRDRRSRLAQALQPQKCHRLLLIILAGDIATNPGPTKFPCGVCTKPVAKNHRALQCESCEFWIHIKCGNVTPAEYILLGNLDDPWLCKTCNDVSINQKCTLSAYKQDTNCINGFTEPNISEQDTNIEPTLNLEQPINHETISTCFNMNNINDSLIFQQGDLSFNSTISYVSEQNPTEEHNNHSFQDDINTSTNTDVDHLNELKNLRKANLKRPLISHLNINSVKNKFTEIHDILSEKLVDMLILSETKLDNSYNNNIYNFPGYKMERKDRNKHGGGILIYVRDDLPFRRRKEFE